MIYVYKSIRCISILCPIFNILFVHNLFRIEVLDWGWVNRDRYIDLLSSAHVVVSTADHEFFGVSMYFKYSNSMLKISFVKSISIVFLGLKLQSWDAFQCALLDYHIQRYFLLNACTEQSFS